MLIEDIPIPEELTISVKREHEFARISDENIELLVDIIKQQPLTCPGEIQDLAREFCYVVSIRPGREDLVYKVLKEVVQTKDFPKKQFLGFRAFRSLGGPYLLRRLLTDGVIDLSYINAGDMFSKYELYFLPEFLKMPGFVIPNYMEETVEEIYQNDFTKTPAVLLEGWEENSLGYTLKHDDIDQLQHLSLLEGFDYNLTIDSNYECSFNHFDGMKTLINIAAFFGSIRCFKYLLMNGADIEADMPKLAIMGGSTEIIQICRQKNMHFLFGFYAALNFRRYDVFDWLVNNEMDDLDGYPRKVFFDIRSITSYLFMFAMGFSPSEPEILYYSTLNSLHPMTIYLISQNKGSSQENMLKAAKEGQDVFFQQFTQF